MHCGSVNMTGGSAETDSGLDFLFCDLIEWKSAAGSAHIYNTGLQQMILEM